MTDTYKLYASWTIEGSYFNHMLECGDRYNQWVQIALEYLPQGVLDENKESLVFISTAQRDACRVARYYCENREVIILSERILPKQNASEDRPEVRYFIYVVLHEVAHAIKKHKSPKFDSLTEGEYQAQEAEADELALQWFNEHVEARKNPHLKKITTEEISESQKKNHGLMENLFSGV
jgi:Zn-dependent peptidase ImmA (M78 family)